MSSSNYKFKSVSTEYWFPNYNEDGFFEEIVCEDENEDNFDEMEEKEDLEKGEFDEKSRKMENEKILEVEVKIEAKGVNGDEEKLLREEKEEKEELVNTNGEVLKDVEFEKNQVKESRKEIDSEVFTKEENIRVEFGGGIENLVEEILRNFSI
ncbi:rRNA-processing protein EBP2-like [Cornus florida]|uniref:rRNA-processing protein EBP2-like n=1 Tax=Cornus florida TaxID=4283 RepID=UPI0028A07B95|nr:rRNA-processing protein EBP2-like [Cornus florida]